jgi:hypothetical protein
MTVVTDGILLGAWANISDNSQILDIGRGTRLLVMMLAQSHHGDRPKQRASLTSYHQFWNNIGSPILVLIGLSLLLLTSRLF